jgi:membrane protein DedA with SNARE-associated domain
MIIPTDGALMECLSLFAATFVQEDLAIITGGMMAVDNSLPVVVVFLTLMSGIFTGDVIIYAMGWAARKIPWVKRKLINKRVEKARDKLQNNLVSTIVLVRMIPGLLFSTFIACGFIGVSFIRFIITSVIAAAVYTAAALFIIIKLGEATLPTIGVWFYVVVISIGVLIILIKYLKQKKMTAEEDVDEGTQVSLNEKIDGNAFLGMPSLKDVKKKVALSEKIPSTLFYSPLGLRWVFLGVRYHSLLLPTVTNPLVEAGGLWGESKSRLMDQIGPDYRQWVAPFTTVYIKDNKANDENISNILGAMKKNRLSFPLVVKPDIGWQGYGVRVINHEEELRNYLPGYPSKATLIIQELVPYEGEAGVFYSRFPGEEHGKVISLTFRYYPHVIGDGISTVAQLMQQDQRTRFKLKFYLGKETLHAGIPEEYRNYIPLSGEVFRLAFIGSIRVGGLYRNGIKFITPELQQRFDEIGESIPEFYFGRFDIKFKNIDSLREGKDFKIFEINGAGAEAIHVWDAETPLLTMYKELFRYQSIMFRIANANRKRGFKPMPAKEFYTFTKEYNNLISNYPASE